MAKFYTPAYIIEAARETMGGIDLDPATDEEANELVKAGAIYTEREDGLLQPWFGRIWLNPPFGAQDTRRFVGRAVDLYDRGLIEQVCILIPYTPDNRTVTTLIGRFPHCHPRRKVLFGRPRPEPRRPIQFATPIFYLGPHVERFGEMFSGVGSVCQPVAQFKSFNMAFDWLDEAASAIMK